MQIFYEKHVNVPRLDPGYEVVQDILDNVLKFEPESRLKIEEIIKKIDDAYPFLKQEAPVASKPKKGLFCYKGIADSS